MFIWDTVVNAATSLIGKPLEQWGERKKIKTESETAVAKLEATARVETAKATVEMAKNNQITERDWDARAQENMKNTWMDEIIAVTFLFPIWVVFAGAIYEIYMFPSIGISVAMVGAVQALAAFPLWFVCMECGVVASYLGLRWLVQPLVQKLTGNRKTMTLLDVSGKKDKKDG